MKYHRHFYFLPEGLLVLLLLCVPANAQAALSPTSGTANFLLQKSISLTEAIVEMAAKPQALSIYTTNPDILSAADTFAGLDAENPLQAYLLTLPNTAFLAAASADSESIQTPETLPFLYKTVRTQFYALLADSYTTQYLALCSILTETAYWVRPTGWTDNTLVFLVYDGGLASVSTYMQTDSGYLTVKCELLPTEAGKLLTAAASLSSRLSGFVENPVDCITELDGGKIRQLIAANPGRKPQENPSVYLPDEKNCFFWKPAGLWYSAWEIWLGVIYSLLWNTRKKWPDA